MKDLLQQLNIDDEHNELQIKDVKYNLKTKEITIVLQGNNILHHDLFMELKTKLTDYLELTDEFVVHYYYQCQKQIYEAITLISFYKEVLKNNKDLNLLLANTTIEVVKETNTIIFDLDNKYDEKIIKVQETKISKELAKFGFKDIKFTYHQKEVTQEFKEKMEQRIKESEAKIIQNSELVQTKKSMKKLLFGEDFTASVLVDIKDIVNPQNQIRRVTFKGVVFNYELRELKKSSLLTMMVSDDTSTIICKTFTGFGGKSPTVSELSMISNGMELLITGTKNYDKFIGDDIIELDSITILNKNQEITQRQDEAENKRVELHVHSKMSTNNGISSMDSYMAMAKHFGHQAIAITDHDGVQGFVDAEKAAKKYGIKPIYGVEATVVDTPIVVRNATDVNIQAQEYTIFDLETTGLSANFNKLIEIGAVKIKEGNIISRFQTFIKIAEPLSDFTTSLTGITNEDIQTGISLKEGLKQFKEYYQGTTLVAHNATFDYQFLNKNERTVLQQSVDVEILDTLELSRILNPENTFHSLKILTKKYGVQMDASSHHRADYDSEKLAELFIAMLAQIKKDYPEFIKLNDLNQTDINKTRGFHELIYVKNQKGLADLYKLVSDAHTVDYLLEPRIRVDYIKQNQQNFYVVGSGCVKSKLVDYYLNKTIEELTDLIKYYDFIELHPQEQYAELIKADTFKSLADVQTMHQTLISIAKEVGTQVIASSNAHFINPNLYKIKEILMAKDLRFDKVRKNRKTGEEYFPDVDKFNSLQEQKTEKFKHQYYYTTEEMLATFDYLDEKTAYEIVVENTNLLADSVDELKIVPDELYTPEIAGVDEKLTNMVYEHAKKIYSDDLPELVVKRIEKEVNSITKYGFSVIYYISHKLVKHSLDNGYLVGSRGSVGSSIVATFMDITEINPLPPHYICTKCQHHEFFTEGEYASGFDLPDKKCPTCQENMRKDGQDIPFETFLGFEGDKVPDIDLNFSGEFQGQAHDYVRGKDKLNDDELFDYEHAFRAGTIGTLAEKTAFAYTKNYFELQNITPRKSDILFYSKECEGIKRTTGQHPGGIIVVPNHLNIYDFTAIQYPANDKKQPWRTTHFDFHSIHDNLLKLDILGHDDPTMLKKLYDLTNIDPKYLDVSDEKIMQLFTSTESLGINDPEYFSLGTLGVPEFGTDFVMGMLKETKPASFSELVQISGLSHGTDVWLGNARDLIEDGTCVLKDVIGCRDDIMVNLMYQGIEAKKAFSIMENVRKGKGLTPEEIAVLNANNIPKWYIESCQKIKYMFPKAHAAAYVLMALRIAYYKVYYPLEYYCAYFSSRVDDFDPVSMLKGEKSLKKRIELLKEFDSDLSEIKKKSLTNSLKMSLEMVERGFEFLKFDLNNSQAFEFTIDKKSNGLIMPFSIIDGLGEKEAQRIVEEREISEFATKEDLKKRTKIKAKSMEQLEFFGVLEGLDESNQMSLF